jgi:hypothetical protein
LMKEAVEIMKKLDSIENRPDGDASGQHSKQHSANRA